MAQITHKQVRDILEGGEVDGGRLVYMKLDIDQGDQNPTISNLRQFRDEAHAR